jgi:hypothetical protein
MGNPPGMWNPCGICLIFWSTFSKSKYRFLGFWLNLFVNNQQSLLETNNQCLLVNSQWNCANDGGLTGRPYQGADFGVMEVVVSGDGKRAVPGQNPGE